jgi:hypothetical protein
VILAPLRFWFPGKKIFPISAQGAIGPPNSSFKILNILHKSMYGQLAVSLFK